MGATIPGQFAEVVARAPDAIAVTCGDSAITRVELDRSSNRLARAYAELGVTPGSYVTIMLPNSIEWYQAALAVWKLGAIPQPLPLRMPEAERGELLALVPRSLTVGGDSAGTGVPGTGVPGTARVPIGYRAGHHPDDPLPEAVSPAWKAMASGGSTGRPKLIQVMADSRVDLAATGRAFGLEPDETQLVTGPLSHNNSMMMSVMGLALGHHLVVMRRFDAAEMLRLIRAHGVSFLATVPTVLQRALVEYRADPSGHDLSSLRRIWHGAAPCPPTVKREWIDLVGPDALWEYYGGTELQAGTFIGGHDWLEHPGSVGTVAIGSIQVQRPDGTRCPAGEVGEIFMRPAGEPTYRYIGAERDTRGEWETIGDLGYFDEDGYLYLSDRRVDMFNVGGAKVYPAEIESALSAHPSVLSCLVVGVPDDDLGQVPYALVQPAPGAEPDPAGYLDFLRDRLIGYKVPRYLELVTHPLRDDAGKARRSAVRQEVIDRMTVDVNPIGGSA